MTTHTLAGIEPLGATPIDIGDYVVYRQIEEDSDGPTAGDLPWQVALVTGPHSEALERLGAFSSKANALTFVLAHETTGWEDGGLLRASARRVLAGATLVHEDDALLALGFALEACDESRPRVLAVTEQGFTRLHVSAGVDAVAINCDVLETFEREDIVPLHDTYAPMLRRLDINWPVSPEGRLRERAWMSKVAATSKQALPTS